MKLAINPHRPLEAEILAHTPDVPDFPKAGVVFKDLGPVWANATLRRESLAEIAKWVREQPSMPTAIAGIESRGFLFGMALAFELDLPFIALRKPGKLPGPVNRIEYELEYGRAALECQCGAFSAKDSVLVHDDVLATGGTAQAAGHLIEQSGAAVWGFSFVLELRFLNGGKGLQAGFGQAVRHSLASIEK